MVDPGDTVSRTLKKEFGEEAMNSLELTESEQKKIQNMLTQLFQNGNTVRNNLFFKKTYSVLRRQSRETNRNLKRLVFCQYAG